MALAPAQSAGGARAAPPSFSRRGLHRHGPAHARGGGGEAGRAGAAAALHAARRVQVHRRGRWPRLAGEEPPAERYHHLSSPPPPPPPHPLLPATTPAAARLQASLAAKLLLGSVVLAQPSAFPLWFQPLLQNASHLVSLGQLRELPRAVAALRASDGEARDIGRRGAERMRALLREEHLVGYVHAVVREYARALGQGGEEAGPPLGAVRTYHKYCRDSATWYCSHHWKGRPPRFDDRS